VIDTHGNQQDPLFPVSMQEREQMQEQHLDLLERIAKDTQTMKMEVKAQQAKIDSLKRQVGKIEELLRASRPRK
jgi:polyhydroxyalkanoate synthesis regulator phasin